MGAKVPIYRFGKQLQTKRAEDFGQPDEFRVFQNGRVRDGLLSRRPGRARVAVAGTDHESIVFTPGSSDVLTVPNDTRVWTLGLRWSLRTVLRHRVSGNTEYLLGYAGAGVGSLTIRVSTTDKLVAVFTDSGATATTLTGTTSLVDNQTYSVLVTRDKNTFKLYLDNTVDASSASVSATLLGRAPTAALTIGANNGANYYGGTVDNLELYGTVFADNADGMLRCADPMAEDVLACYTMEQDANRLITDLSRFGNTGLCANVQAAGGALAVQSAVAQGMAPWTDKNGKKRMMVVAGGRVYTPELV